MTFIFPSKNPSSRVILGKQRGNNALATTKNAMPAKFYPSDNTNHFSLNRFSNKKHTLSDTTYTDTSSYIQKKKAHAVGVQSTYSGNFAYKSNVQNDRKQAVTRVRSGGSVVPLKKRNKHLL
tara:strand:+ start:247 stop:612 length:366 start_codon:yes stop_codon:yes gene_type:complete